MYLHHIRIQSFQTLLVVGRVPPIDPYEAERKRWEEEVPPTPPLFSRDPAIREGPGGQRIYGIEEFGMESFEEPAWEPAEQFFKHRHGKIIVHHKHSHQHAFPK